MVTKMDTHSSMITELAATITTSNAINAEMLSARPSLGLSNPSPDESLSAVHERVRESLSVSLDRLFGRDCHGDDGSSRKRKGESDADSMNKRVKPSENTGQAQSVHKDISPENGNVGLSSVSSQDQHPSTSGQAPLVPGTVSQVPAAANTPQLDRSVPMDISTTLTDSNEGVSTHRDSGSIGGCASQTTPPVIDTTNDYLNNFQTIPGTTQVTTFHRGSIQAPSFHGFLLDRRCINRTPCRGLQSSNRCCKVAM